MAGESWMLRVETLLQAVELEERKRAEDRWWRLRYALGEKEFDHLCSRLGPRLGPTDLCEPVSDVDELLSRLQDGWPEAVADAALFGSS